MKHRTVDLVLPAVVSYRIVADKGDPKYPESVEISDVQVYGGLSITSGLTEGMLEMLAAEVLGIERSAWAGELAEETF